MTLTPDEQGHDIGVANLTGTDGIPEQSHALQEPLTAGELIVNLRAEADPDALQTLVQEVFRAGGRKDGLHLEIEHLEAFRPARPTPTHRLRASESGMAATQAAPV